MIFACRAEDGMERIIVSFRVDRHDVQLRQYLAARRVAEVARGGLRHEMLLQLRQDVVENNGLNEVVLFTGVLHREDGDGDMR